MKLYTRYFSAHKNGRTCSCFDFNLFFSLQEVEFIHEFYTYICDSQARDIFLGVLYGYKAALQIVALVLSFGIRKVKVKGLDDSKYIAAAVYVTSIVLAVVIVATYTLDEFINGYAAVFCTGFSIGTTVILCIVFIPKVRTHYSSDKYKSLVDYYRCLYSLSITV